MDPPLHCEKSQLVLPQISRQLEFPLQSTEQLEAELQSNLHVDPFVQDRLALGVLDVVRLQVLPPLQVTLQSLMLLQ